MNRAPDLGHVDEGVRAGPELVDVRARPGRHRQPREEAAGDARDVEHQADLEALPAAPSDHVLCVKGFGLALSFVWQNFDP